jgi:uncharacterized protein YaiL (DUF2058 family)
MGMALSLQEQLLKQGLVDDKKAKQIKQEKRRKGRQEKQKPPQPNEVAERARAARAEQAERDRQANRERQLEAERKAVAAQIRQLVETHRLTREQGTVDYQFVDGKKIKKILVSDVQQDQLARGRIAVARYASRDGTSHGYELVPANIAEKIRQRDEETIVVLNTAAAEDEDDPYADYPIPDDLMW